MSEWSEGRVASEPQVVRVSVDPVELESRLASIERRLAEFEARERRLLELIDAVHRLTETIGPLVKGSRPTPAPERRKPDWPLPAPAMERAASAGSGPVAPERIARAHARLRETLFAAPPAAEQDSKEEEPAEAEAQASPPSAPVAQPSPPRAAPPLESLAAIPPPHRSSWLLRALKPMVKRDPVAAGRLLRELLPAHALAELPPIAELPGPPEAIAPLLVRGRMRRRIGWEKARLRCPPKAVSELVPLSRMRASPSQLRAAGVRLDPELAFTLVAFAIDPAWAAGNRFTIAHRGPERVTYLSVHDRAWPTVASMRPGGPAVASQRPGGPVTTTICCLDEALFAVLCGEPPAGVSVLGPIAPLELVQRWFARATG